MIISPILIALSENDKRLIFALLIVIILVLVLMGYLCFLLVKLMKWQSKRMDTLIHDVVITKVITDKKHLVSYGRKKNWALFFKQAYVPLIIVAFGLIILLIRDAVYSDYSYNPFNKYDGFGSIFWTWKFSDEFVGGNFIRFNKLVIDTYPHFAPEGWGGYISVPCFLVGGTWYLLIIMALISRTVLLHKRSRDIFEKSLEGYNQNEADKNEVSSESN